MSADDMAGRLAARGAAIGGTRVAAILAAVAAAELPAGCSAERGEDAVVIRGPGLARRLAYDARLGALGLIARGA